MATSELEQVQRDEPVLEPILSERYALQWRHVGVCTAFSLFFVYLNYLPLFHSDIWGHVLYGQWMLEHASLPTQDPFLPLAEGMRVVDNAWGSQVFLAWVVQVGGAAALSNLFAVVVMANYLLQARLFYLVSKSLPVMFLALFISFVLGFSRHMVIRPEILGALFCSLLLLILVRLEPWRSRAKAIADDHTDADHFPAWLWIAVPVLFILWANSHGSFAVGLVVLACHVAGRAIEVAWQKQDLGAIIADPQFRRWLILTELGVAATLINPYGLDLLIETARFGQNPNLKEVIEWFPLQLNFLEGYQFSFALIILIVVLRHSKQAVRPAEVLALLAFIWLMAGTVRFIGWLAPIMALAITPHAADIWERLRPSIQFLNRAERPQPVGAAKFYLSLSCLLIVWCAFAISPISQALLGGKGRQPELLYNEATPLGISEYMRNNPPEGLTFCPQWWGDFLVLETGGKVQPFMTTSIHLAPERVWKDYLTVARGQSGWNRILDRYAVDTIVLHEGLQPQTVELIKGSADWRLAYEDDDGVVLVRTDRAVAANPLKESPHPSTSEAQATSAAREPRQEGAS